MNDADRRTVAREAARAGGEVALDRFRGSLTVEEKTGKTDIVTEADRAAQRAVFERIRETFPDDPIVGEEEDALKTVPEVGPAWIVDPIDGTNNYARGIRLWCTAVAAVVDGDPVAAATALPAIGDAYAATSTGVTRDGDPLSVSERDDPERCTVTPTFWWSFDRRDQFAAATRATVERFGDVRRFGSAQVTLAMVAEGALDGTFTNLRPTPWDAVGGVHLVRQAGGRVTDLDGNRWRHDSTGLVASNGRIHEDVLAAACEAARA